MEAGAGSMEQEPPPTCTPPGEGRTPHPFPVHRPCVVSVNLPRASLVQHPHGLL